MQKQPLYLRQLLCCISLCNYPVQVISCLQSRLKVIEVVRINVTSCIFREGVFLFLLVLCFAFSIDFIALVIQRRKFINDCLFKHRLPFSKFALQFMEGCAASSDGKPRVRLKAARKKLVGIKRGHFGAEETSALTGQLYNMETLDGSDSPLPFTLRRLRNCEKCVFCNLCYRSHLYELFGQIEKEFEALYIENMSLHTKVEALTDRLTEGGMPLEKAAEIFAITSEATSSKSAGGKKPCSLLFLSFKVGSDQNRARFVRAFKGHRDGVWHVDAAATGVICSASADHTARIWCTETGACFAQYLGHEGSVNCARFAPIPIGNGREILVVSASGDQSAHVWKAPTAFVGGQTGGSHQSNIILHHSSEDEKFSDREENLPDGLTLRQRDGKGATRGSVNVQYRLPIANNNAANACHPLYLRWCQVPVFEVGRCSVHEGNQVKGLLTEFTAQNETLVSWEDMERTLCNLAKTGHSFLLNQNRRMILRIKENDTYVVIRSPQLRLTGHTAPVVAADWLWTQNRIVTASWDRTAIIFDSERGEIVNILSGHDLELNHCCAHSSQNLVVTASKDTTFRLWDFRESIHSVAVFQGHTESVTSVVFTGSDKIVSGSDDRSVKVWDFRNMRTALSTIRLDSSVNRIAISRTNGIIAIPTDNRQVRLCDMAGSRITRLPSTSRRLVQGHHRMVCCCAWADESSNCNLFTCGFDRLVLGWNVSMSQPKEKE
ncbi:hypothetical protein M513_09347 [Trichuris suis]|uniref:WD repeat-containing protein 37 n=1 Tax=Trichuris suis TaxID=68888 RepID=A0A085LXQ6_9BILA|nr:hypothetical protein M513_09347 [Trichuris suis]